MVRNPIYIILVLQLGLCLVLGSSIQINNSTADAPVYCDKNAPRRIDCGWPGITQSRCESFPCCWDSSNPNDYNCFIPSGGDYSDDPTCDFSSPVNRLDCGWAGITKAQCETRGSKGCCFDSRITGVPNCFWK